MTDEEINKAITEACGWKCAGHPDRLKATDGRQFGYQFVIRPDGQLVTHNSIPNYCNDLNAMHEAEAVLSIADTYDYTNLLYDIACKNQEQTGKWLPYSIRARQRAEAFLRTLGKWKE